MEPGVKFLPVEEVPRPTVATLGVNEKPPLRV
jgi:hypothetical protein